MSDVTIYGLAPSAYVRTALLVCEAKGVSYALEPVDFRSEAYQDHHPFNHMPALRHGDVNIYETLAITTYLDEAFDGASLQPTALMEKVKMLQWISAINDYIYGTLVGVCITERIIKQMRGMEADETRIAAAIPAMAHYLDTLNTAITGADYLAGEKISLADYFLAPILSYFAQTPEGDTMLPACPALVQWHERMRSVATGYEAINASLQAA